MRRKLFIILSLAILSLLMAGTAIGDGGAGNGTGNGTVTQPSTSGFFTDVPKDHWAYDDLKYLVDRGIITGLPGGKYNGDAALDRYSAAALIARAIRYLQNNPESVTPQDLDVLKDLIFKVSDRLSALEASTGQGGQPSSLEARVAQNEKAIAQLQTQGKGATTNFIIAVTALLVAIIAVALATLGL